MHRLDRRQIFLHEVYPLASQFGPNATVRDFTAPKTITTVSGVSGVGKDTILSSSGLAFVKGFTTRPQRDGEIPGVSGYSHYYDLREASARQDIRDALLSGSFVQVMPHPDTFELYGTRPEDYSADNCVMDVMGTAFERMKRQRLFKRMSNIHVVTSDFGITLGRLIERDGTMPADRIGRLHEGVGSLQQALTNEQTIFVVNDDKDTAIAQVRDVVEGSGLPEHVLQAGRAAGAAMLDGLTNYLSSIGHAHLAAPPHQRQGE